MKKIIASFKKNAKRPERRLSLVAVLLGLVSAAALYTYVKDKASSAVSFTSGSRVQVQSMRSINRKVEHQANGLRYHAIVIGVNEYGEAQQSGWKNLHTAVNDSARVGDLLEDKYGFTVHRLLDEEASLQNVVTTLDRELVGLGPEDAALIYFAGHGYFDDEYGEGYWVPHGTPFELDGRPARERWISNSLVSEILEASAARHILVVADSCYSGSLFNKAEESTEPTVGMARYNEVIQIPSRYLLTSGNLEPVLDSGGTHSVFAGEFLDFLSAPPQKVFSASELGLQIRAQISGVADQRVRLESLDLSTHEGGEFIFSMQHSAWPEAEKLRSLSGAYSSAAPDLDLSRVLLLHRSGAPEAAKLSAEKLKKSLVEPGARQQLSVRLEDGFSMTQSKVDITQLIAELEERADQQQDPEGLSLYAKPRVVAWMGPSLDQGYKAEAMEVIYQFALDKALLDRKGFTVMARGQMDELLKNLNLGSSSLSNPEARLALRKIMPAGVLLVSQLAGSAGSEQLFVKVVDVETAETLGVLRGVRDANQDEFSIAQNMVDEIEVLLKDKKPLTAGVLDQTSATVWQIGMGRFHGAYEGMEFTVVQQEQTVDGAYGDHRSVARGVGKITQLSDMSSTAEISLNPGVNITAMDRVRAVER